MDIDSCQNDNVFPLSSQYGVMILCVCHLVIWHCHGHVMHESRWVPISTWPLFLWLHSFLWMYDISGWTMLLYFLTTAFGRASSGNEMMQNGPQPIDSWRDFSAANVGVSTCRMWKMYDCLHWRAVVGDLVSGKSNLAWWHIYEVTHVF